MGKENRRIALKNVVKERGLKNGFLRLYDANGDYFDVSPKGQKTYWKIKEVIRTAKKIVDDNK